MAEAHPGGLPVGHGGEGARCQGHPHRPAVHPHQRGGGRLPADPGRDRHRPARRGDQLHPQQREGLPGVRPRVHERVVRRHRGVPGHRGPRRACSPGTTPTPPRTTRGPGSTRAWRGRHRPARRTPPGPGRRPPGCSTSPGDRTSRGRRGPRRRIRRCSIPAASTRSSSGTTRATRPRWSPRSAASREQQFLRLCAGLDGELGAGAHHRRRLLRRLDPAQRRRADTSGRRRSSSSCSGNMGRPGGGIMAMRGHASIQGSTDIPTLFNLLPGYLPMPHAPGRTRRSRSTSTASSATRQKGFWRNADAYVSLPAEGVLGRRRDGGQRLLLRLPATADRRPRHVPHRDGHDRRQGVRVLPARAEPGRRVRPRQAPAARDGEPRLARRPRPRR